MQTGIIPQRGSSRLAIAALIVFLILVCLPIRFWIGPVQMTGLRLYLALLALPLVIIWLKDIDLRRDPVAAFLALFVGWSAVAISHTSPDHMIENSGAVGLETLCAYLLARIAIRSKATLRTVSLTSALLVLTLLPFAMIEARSGAPVLVHLIDGLPGISSVDTVSIEPRLGLERAQTTFAHPIHFGIFACSTFALITLGMRGHVAMPWKALLAIAALLATALSLSSGPILALAAQIGLLIWIISFGHRKSSWFALIALLLTAYITVDLLSNRTPVRVFMSYATFSPHNAFWRGLIFEWGMLNVWESPIFGIGFNDWQRPTFMRSGSIDNFWLATAMKYGIPGFLLLVAATITALWRGLPKGGASLPRLAWAITMISLILALCTVHVWTSIHAYFFFLLGAGQYAFAAGTKTVPHPKLQRHEWDFSRDMTPIYTRNGLAA